MRAQGRDHRRRSREPAAGQSRRDDAARHRRADVSGPRRVAAPPPGSAGAGPDRTRTRAEGKKHGQIAARHHQNCRGWIDPGVFRAAALARLLQWRAEWSVVRAAGAIARSLQTGTARRRADPHAHERRRSDRAGARLHRGGVARASLSRSSLHIPALPARRRRSVPPDEVAWLLRQPVPQPSLLLGRPALCVDGRPGEGGTHERLRDGARDRRTDGDPFRCTGNAARTTVYGVVRGQPADGERADARGQRAHLGR